MVNKEWNKRLVFLCYLNRSGSTLLAKRLDAFREISVGIEEEFIDGIRKGKVNINNPAELKSYLHELSKTDKFEYWNIDVNDLYEELENLKYPIKYNSILTAIHKRHFSDSDTKVIVHKKALYVHHKKRIESLFPYAKIIFINRDPRGIFCSQQKSRNSIRGNIMQKNVVRFAISYMYNLKMLNRWRNNRNLLIVNYENLVESPTSVENKIASFLNVSSEKVKESDYFDKIPNKQKHLHSNLTDDILKTNRTKAWQQELKSLEVDLLQFIFGSHLRKMGLEIVKTELGVEERFKMFFYIIQFYVLFPLKFLMRNFRS